MDCGGARNTAAAVWRGKLWGLRVAELLRERGVGCVTGIGVDELSKSIDAD